MWNGIADALCMAAFLAGLSGCSDKNEAGDSGSGAPVLGEAIVEPSCSPDDGMAYTFMFGLSERSCGVDAPEADEWMRISIWANLDELGGSSWDVSSDSDEGGVWFFGEGGTDEFVDASVGELYANQWGVSDGVTGTYEVTLSDGTERSGSFDALLCMDEDPECG